MLHDDMNLSRLVVYVKSIEESKHKQEFRTTMFNDDMNLSRLIVYAQSI